MKFNIFSTWELIYKKIIYILISFISALCICWYLKLPDTQKTDTAYIVSILYALFLFLIQIYDNYMKNKIDEKFHERKDYYLNLKDLKEIFNLINYEDCSEEDVYKLIIDFKVFTRPTDNNRKPYIPIHRSQSVV